MKVLSLAAAMLILSAPISMAKSFDQTDKALFAAVVATQVLDGLTTAHGQSVGNIIHKNFAWKYGTNRPSAARLWGVKAAEIGIAYGVARILPDKYRKIFLTSTAMLLFACGVNNELSFRITY